MRWSWLLIAYHRSALRTTVGAVLLGLPFGFNVDALLESRLWVKLGAPLSDTTGTKLWIELGKELGKSFLSTLGSTLGKRMIK